MKRLIANVSGNINKEGYCSIVVTLARALALKGYIEILSDDRAFIIAEGKLEDLEKFISSIWIGDGKIEVKEILSDYRDPTGEFYDFHKILPPQHEQVQPPRKATERTVCNFMQAPDRMQRPEREICTPNHDLKVPVPDLEQLEEPVELFREEGYIPESSKPLPNSQRKLSLNK